MEPAVDDATTVVEDKDDEIVPPKTKRSCLLLIFNVIMLHACVGSTQVIQPFIFFGLLFLCSGLSGSSLSACGILWYIPHGYMPDVIKRLLPTPFLM
jgi:hypothetical protein